MFPGSPTPLPPTCPLFRVTALVRSGEVLGVWLRLGAARVRLRVAGGRGALLAASDLGVLLRRCQRVAVRDGLGVIALPSAQLIAWRVLEIVLGTPYLPPPEQLRALFPTLRAHPGTLILPLGLGSAEEALGLCAAARIPVVASRIRYAPGSGSEWTGCHAAAER